MSLHKGGIFPYLRSRGLKTFLFSFFRLEAGDTRGYILAYMLTESTRLDRYLDERVLLYSNSERQIRGCRILEFNLRVSSVLTPLRAGQPGTGSTYTPAMPKHAGMTFRHARIIDPQMTGVREI
jgi:hypothetical protein